METRAVIGTAGHVDHGKTTLVRELTGIDTDRLDAEKARGISIELGFAWLPLGDARGGRAAIVDVPGHERFVRQMIAGAAGVDLVLLVVAADEGVMPQTREHLDICRLLGVRRGAVVLTKRDLVEPGFLELAQDDVREAVAGTFLEGAPIVPFAAGAPEDRARVAALVTELVGDAEDRGLLAARSGDRPFKLSVDRAFSMRGFGTVVTGTTGAGEIAVGDAVAVCSGAGEIAARVRGIELHGEAVARVGRGARAALNLAGIDHGEVHRGDVIATPGALRATSMIDATLTALGTLPEPLRDGARALLHVGTAQVEATVALLGAAALAPGATGWAQLRLAEPRVVLPGERFVLRGFDALPGHGKTIGGGRALAASQRRHKRQSAEAVALCAALDGEDARAAARAWVAMAGEGGVATSALAPALPLDGAAIAVAVPGLVADRELAEGGGRLYEAAALGRVEERAVA
ncbi:MAG: selenocysteine-specific translation elongation factor, partial [Myxococcales bacterium]|nr:selenocysteine-specific translation elongation factor [Myxococcales bacterium]